MSASQTRWMSVALLLSGFAAGCGGAGDTDSATQSVSASGGAVVDDASASESVVSTANPVRFDEPAAVASPQSTAGKTPVLTVSVESPGKSAVAASHDVESESVSDQADGKSPFPDDEATQTLREIQELRIAPLPADLSTVKAARRERNEQIVEKATQVLRLTMSEEARQPQFHRAIGQLLEARFQMALTGTQEDVDLFYADVQALNDRDPKSIAAAEGVYYIAKFAHTQASMHGRNQPDWFSTLSRWAREFADRFPEQQKRAVSLLFGAGRSCELQAQATTDAELSQRLMTESILCYTALAEKFPTTDQGQEATASLRRNALVGQKLSQFSGPTADGGLVNADDFPGRPTLIYFWDSESDQFTNELLPLLEKLRKQLSSNRLRMIGVALDEDESTMNSYMETHNVPGQQIFFPNQQQRSWNSPLIRFWGIASTPSVWLVDSEGIVTTTTVSAADLVTELKKIVK